MKKIILPTFFALAVLPLCVLPVPAQQPKVEVPIARKLCDLRDARINESSGLAASIRYAKENLLWTHNDSGGEPKLFCVNLKGETVVEVLLQNATNVDWEDIAIAGDFIFIGDIGDNWHTRENITIYRLKEPQFDPNGKGQVLSVPCEKMTLKYPDGAHDCETLLVEKDAYRQPYWTYLVTKNGGASQIYRVPEFRDGAAGTLLRVGEYSFTGKDARSYLATGGSVSPDGRHLVIRTYTHAYEWSISIKRSGRGFGEGRPRIFELPLSKQGESICYSADGSKYFATSEGVPCPLFEIENEK